MVRKIAIHQPNFIPRLKVLQKIARAGEWCILDDIQYVTREYQNRTRLRQLKNPTWEFWLTIPVKLPNGRKTPINQVTISNPDETYERIEKTLRFTYGTSDYWSWIEAYTSQLLLYATESMSLFDIHSTLTFFSLLDIRIEYSHSTDYPTTDSKTQRLIDLCTQKGANVYVAGEGSRAYMVESNFIQAGITVEWQRWKNPYHDSQLDFRNYAALDYVARFGPELARKHLFDW